MALYLLAAVAPSARAQTLDEDAHLITSLAGLVQLKGFKGVGLGRICEELSLAGPCEAAHLNFVQRGHTPSFNILGASADRTARVIIINHRCGRVRGSGSQRDCEAGSAQIYLTGFDGRLVAVLAGKSSPQGWTYSRLDIDAATEAGFARELMYWRDQKAAIESAPDRRD